LSVPLKSLRDLANGKITEFSQTVLAELETVTSRDIGVVVLGGEVLATSSSGEGEFRLLGDGAETGEDSVELAEHWLWADL